MTTNTLLFDPVPLASKDLNIAPRQVAAVALLFAEGNTVPFIARYRKEAHGNLDEVQITDIQEKLAYYNSLESRRQTIINSIEVFTPSVTHWPRARIMRSMAAVRSSAQTTSLPMIGS